MPAKKQNNAIKIQTTNHFNTFIEVSEGYPAASGEIPTSNENIGAVANLEDGVLKKFSYQFTSEEMLLQVNTIKNDLRKEKFPAAKNEFFSKKQTRFRVSSLTKRFGRECITMKKARWIWLVGNQKGIKNFSE